jgi:hypothetical protein
MMRENKKGFSKLHGVDYTSNDAVTLTAHNVWKDNDKQNGVLTKATFMPFLRELRPEDYDHTEKLFVYLKEQRRFANSLKMRKDRGKQLYYWADFYQPNGNEGTKVIGDPELLKLVQLYREGKVVIDFNIDDLIDEGLTTNS